MILESAHKRIRQATLLALASMAALVGQSGSRAPSERMTTAPRVEQKVSPVVKKAPLPSAQQSPQKTKDTTQNSQATSEICIPWMPELKFSNKFSSFPVPEVQNLDYYLKEEYLSDKSKYSSTEAGRVNEALFLRKAAPYIPDVFYEKSKLPYAERMKFYESPEKKEIMKALKERFETNDGAVMVLKQPLMMRILVLCNEVIVYGRPLVTLPTETESLREAVDICGLTQLGKWMDIQKAKNRELKNIVPEGYDEKEAQKQRQHMPRLRIMYNPYDYFKAIGVMPEKPIRSDCRYFSEEDFAHLTKKQKEELLDLWGILPPYVKVAPGLNSGEIYKEYMAITSDKTGYMYILNNSYPTNKSKERLRRAQKLAMEMVIYRRPLALLHAENYTLEQVIQVCNFRLAKGFYGRQQKGERITGEIGELGFTIGNLEAKALINLGKKYHHPDWVEFGQEMYDAVQKRIVVKEKRPLEHQVIKIEKTVGKHDDTPVIQHQTAQKSDQSRVRNQ